ncbi:MAG TPA: DUF4166 domain-containing protein [Thermoanaerobaculia bacterium]|nr:DUF4166 domain-containing protein [Thermoanaerobaculia bacterium]
MTSIYQRAMGAEFGKLHPEIRKRFGFGSEDGIASIGSGVMETIWRGPFWTLPFLYVGSVRRIMFPEHGHDVPFTIENYAYRDRFGRETVTWIRKFRGRTPRRFDATMIFSEQRNRVVDYLGTHQHLAVDLDLHADAEGALCLRSGEQRFYEGPIAFRFPLLFSGVANVRESFDETAGRFRIDVEIANWRWGPLFGYRGAFDVEYRQVSEVPEDVKPLREERRE